MDKSIDPIPPPSGPAKNPLEAEGNIIDVILTDPHINYFQQKIEEVIVPLNKKNQAEKGQISPIRSGVESFATTDKR